MDAKITKERLNTLFSYDWVKILLSIVGGILLWSLIFTMTATKISPSQQFTVLNYRGNVQLSETKFFEFYNSTLQNGVFSYEVVETNVRDTVQMAEGTESQLLQATLGTDEGDVMFLSDLPNPDTAYEEDGETKYRKNYLETFLMSEYRYIADLSSTREGGYFKGLEEFLNRFYTQGYERADSLDEGAVKAYFRARVQANKDKRFKTSAQIEAGAQQEVLRVQKYRDALVKMYAYLETGVVSLTDVSMEYDGKTYVKGMLNLCPDEKVMGKLSDYVAYETTYLGEDGSTQKKNTARNMHVVFFDVPGIADTFEYESLPFIVSLIDFVLAA